MCLINNSSPTSNKKKLKKDHKDNLNSIYYFANYWPLNDT